ncbi:MAG: tRNA (guanosine(37)-N1)-methyltransferase TrmD [Clostridiales bacterium]|jgi:tRNA (guanine37-N1)-methyltransferase|nr:tRNA (guanosine(37)-N1)-methyltransferase TrmD [Clostridiales bacterium]
MNINILTLFPDMFSPITEHSIIGRANEKKILNISLINIRDYTLDKHKKTDDTPFGGGAGMVMSADPVFRSLESIDAQSSRIIYMSPKGKLLNQDLIEDLASQQELTILCGRYEGVDQRIIDYWNMEEISVGDYILTGGELPAMILIDAVARFLPDVLGSAESNKEESIYSGLLEYPHYTKPREYRGMQVPEVLLSGNHKMIHLWRLKKALELTHKRRPDLFKAFIDKEDRLTKEEKKVLNEILKDD